MTLKGQSGALGFDVVGYTPVAAGASNKGTSLCFSCFTSNPAPHVWPGNAAEDGPKAWGPCTDHQVSVG